MITKQESKGIQVKAINRRMCLEVPHLEGRIYFNPIIKGPDTHIQVAQFLNETNLQQPTMAQNASLVYAAWQNPKEEYPNQVIVNLKRYQLCGFNGIFYSKNKKGAFIQDRPNIVDGRVVMNASELEGTLSSKAEDGVFYSKDGNVRFVPFGYKTGEQSAKQLE